MPVVELVEPGLCGKTHDVALLSESLISTINTSAKLHNHVEVHKIDMLFI